MNINLCPIIAITTPLNYSGIGIIRISGNDLWIIINKICGKNRFNLIPRYATYTVFKNINGNLLDNGLIIYFQSPFSYTGENVLEIHCHGSPIIMKMLLFNCLKIGENINLRIAQPGEFTKRAFLNKKIDLIQVEAIDDLIKASTVRAAECAIKLLSGSFSKLINSIEKKIKNLRIFIELILNFPEEDVVYFKHIDINKELTKINLSLKKVFKNITEKTILKNGLNVLIIGKPNVGKSSLLNVLSNTNTAIVTNIAGTTRDKININVDINGILFNIIDTAGIKELNNKNIFIEKIEKIGITRTLEEIKKADILLYVIDSVFGLTQEDKKNIKELPLKTKKIFVWNKIDILKKKPCKKKIKGNLHIYISAIKNIGINIIKYELKNIINFEDQFTQKYIIYKKRLAILKKIRKHIKQAIICSFKNKKKKQNINDILAEELKIIQKNLNKITGKKQSNKLLKEIFSRFCIGK